MATDTPFSNCQSSISTFAHFSVSSSCLQERSQDGLLQKVRKIFAMLWLLPTPELTRGAIWLRNFARHRKLHLSTRHDIRMIQTQEDWEERYGGQWAVRQSSANIISVHFNCLSVAWAKTGSWSLDRQEMDTCAFRQIIKESFSKVWCGPMTRASSQQADSVLTSLLHSDHEPLNPHFRYFLKILEKVPINPQITISNAGINPHKMAGEHSVQQSTGAFVVNTFDCIPAFPATFIMCVSGHCTALYARIKTIENNVSMPPTWRRPQLSSASLGPSLGDQEWPYYTRLSSSFWCPSG